MTKTPLQTPVFKDSTPEASIETYSTATVVNAIGQPWQLFYLFRLKLRYRASRLWIAGG